MDSEKAARAALAARSRGFCERCGQPGPTDAAHRKARSQGGKWATSNLLHLCRDCHGHGHKHPAQAYADGRHLRSTQDPTTTPVLIRRGSRTDWALLDDTGTIQWTTPPPEATAC